MTFYSIKNKYKNINFRSLLESDLAYLLDKLKIIWSYEPQAFRLNLGNVYIPDFFLPEQKMWIETKGIITSKEQDKVRHFVEEYRQSLIICSKTDQRIFEPVDDDIWEDEHIQIGKCSRCKKYFFNSVVGIYYCRNCLYCNGNHDNIASTDSNNYLAFIEMLREVIKNGE